MKVIIILSLFVSFTFGSPTGTSTYSCRSKDIFMDDEGCNVCHCNEDGAYAVCTLKMCKPLDWTCAYSGPKEKCYITCECKSSGKEAVCNAEEGGITVEEDCPRGLKYYKDCRTCSCSDGKEQCDRKLIIPGKCTQGKYGDEHFSCLPMCKFMNEENHFCVCKEDGKTAECSKMTVKKVE